MGCMDAKFYRIEVRGVHPLGDREYSITRLVDLRAYTPVRRLGVALDALKEMQRQLSYDVPAQCMTWSCRPQWML
jgi:hypothetical protein